MLGHDYLENYQRFIDEILEVGEVWGIVQNEGCAMCESIEDQSRTVIPFWSDKALAEIHCVDDWQEYKVEKIDLQDFVEQWLPGLKEDELLLGPNWNSALEGLEIEPTELISLLK